MHAAALPSLRALRVCDLGTPGRDRPEEGGQPRLTAETIEDFREGTKTILGTLGPAAVEQLAVCSFYCRGFDVPINLATRKLQADNWTKKAKEAILSQPVPSSMPSSIDGGIQETAHRWMAFYLLSESLRDWFLTLTSDIWDGFTTSWERYFGSMEEFKADAFAEPIMLVERLMLKQKPPRSYHVLSPNVRMSLAPLPFPTPENESNGKELWRTAVQFAGILHDAFTGPWAVPRHGRFVVFRSVKTEETLLDILAAENGPGGTQPLAETNLSTSCNAFLAWDHLLNSTCLSSAPSVCCLIAIFVDYDVPFLPISASPLDLIELWDAFPVHAEMDRASPEKAPPSEPPKTPFFAPLAGGTQALAVDGHDEQEILLPPNCRFTRVPNANSIGFDLAMQVMRKQLKCRTEATPPPLVAAYICKMPRPPL